MLNQNGYNYEPIQQPQEPFEQNYQQNYKSQIYNDENYYSEGVRQLPSPNIKRSKSFKNLLKKFQNATMHGNLEKVQFYVESYGLLNKTEHSLHGGRTCLMLSISKNNKKLISYFCQQPGIDLDARDNNGDTALHIACSLGDMPIIEILIKSGCDPFAKNNCGCTPLYNIVYYGFDKVCDEMLSFYQKRFGYAKTLDFINSQDNEEKTALMYGAMEGKKSYNCVLVLLKWNADTEILDNHGWNAFTYASYHGNFDTCQILLARSKNPNEFSVSEELVFNANNDNPDNKVGNSKSFSSSSSPRRYKNHSPSGKSYDNNNNYNNMSSNIMNRMASKKENLNSNDIHKNYYNTDYNDNNNHLNNNNNDTRRLLSDSVVADPAYYNNNNDVIIDPDKVLRDSKSESYKRHRKSKRSKSNKSNYNSYSDHDNNYHQPENNQYYYDNSQNRRNSKNDRKSLHSYPNNSQNINERSGLIYNGHSYVQNPYTNNDNTENDYDPLMSNSNHSDRTNTIIDEFSSFNNRDDTNYNKSNNDYYIESPPKKIDPYYYSYNINDSYFDDFPDPSKKNNNSSHPNEINTESQYYYDGNSRCYVECNEYGDITDAINGNGGYIYNDKQLNQKIKRYSNLDQQYALTAINKAKLQSKKKRFTNFLFNKKNNNKYDNNIDDDDLPEQWKSVYEDYQHIKTAFKLHHWSGFTKCMTCWIPDIILKKFGKEEKFVILAWREKFTLCLLILFISLMLFFVNIGLFSVLCSKVENWDSEKIQRLHGFSSSNPWVYVRGQIYDLKYVYDRTTGILKSSYMPNNPEEKANYQRIAKSYFGKDLSYIIPPSISNPEEAEKCSRWPTSTNHHMWCDTRSRVLNNGINYCHNSNNTRHYLRVMKTPYYITFTYDEVRKLNKIKGNHIVILRNKIYNITSYLQQPEHYLGEKETKYLSERKGYDIAYYAHNIKKSNDFINCMDSQFMIGKLHGQTEGCLLSYIIMIVVSVVLIGTVAVKLIVSLYYHWFMAKTISNSRSYHDIPEDYLICLITCYSEKGEEIRKTLNSLTVASYNDNSKLLFIVVDGVITGSGNLQTTSDIILSMLEIEHWSSRPMSYCYESVGEIDKQTNMAFVYAGHYQYNCRRVPVILVVKCGKESECNDEKPGNRGKRDSQLILMKFLSSVVMNKKMTALEYDLFKKIYQLTHVYPDQYNFVLMVDADTEIHTDALLKMVQAMKNDPKIMGLCGETMISNKFESWVTMIQIFEYFITHHLGKAFESVFGGVTCLPGCFSMYRVRSQKEGDQYFVPLLTSPAIVNEYASNDVNSLHRKNLFLLGEDRYLTTLMLKNFPRRKTIWVSSAICKTQVPSKFHVLLSQRRRWINSTIHNLLELVMVPQLCGIFCCSMQFVILLELLSTIVLPAFFVLLIYLFITGLKAGYVYLTLGIAFIFIFFQVVLIFCTSQSLSNLFWMFIYMLAYPIWNFLLPIYAFWHFDNFSWGATRKIKCSSEELYYTKGYKKLSRDNLVKKYWYQWEYEKRYHDRERMEHKIKKMRKRLLKYKYREY